MTIATDKLKRDLAAAQAAKVDAESRKRRLAAAATQLANDTDVLLDLCSRATPDPADADAWSGAQTSVSTSSSLTRKTNASY